MRSDFRFKKNESLSLRQTVYKNIREAIIKGHLEPGSRLREVEISEQMGISRGPIREALRLLEQEGLIISHPYRETVVVDICQEEVEKVLVPIRKILENHACLQARNILSEEDFIYLELLVENMNIASHDDDLDTISDFDLQFHQYIMEKVLSPGLLTLWSGIAGKIHKRFLIQGIKHADFSNVVHEHKTYIQLLKNGSPVDIEKHLGLHIT